MAARSGCLSTGLEEWESLTGKSEVEDSETEETGEDTPGSEVRSARVQEDDSIGKVKKIHTRREWETGIGKIKGNIRVTHETVKEFLREMEPEDLVVIKGGGKGLDEIIGKETVW
ncbi:hypothetical protein O3P69_010562 [Scylla paramamosain]|uniref:Uncharacterized protein n=1 Tax=Scylla paramamosain TaxID=85552 RepID=A0AAW0TEJ3_SCYPA